MNKYTVKYMSNDYVVSTEVTADGFWAGTGSSVTFWEKGEMISNEFGPPYNEQVNVAYFGSVIAVELSLG